MENLDLLCHSSIKINASKTIYIDPFRIKNAAHDADYIFCTHSHYDHFSSEDIQKIINNETKIIIVKSSKEEALKLVQEKNLLLVEPGYSYKIDDLEFETTYAYNENKPFHPKENNWVGYLINIDSTKYYIAGDTDNIKEIQNIKCDIALIPVGGKFTMNYEEAADLANKIHAKIVIPTHYGELIGSKEDAINFKELIKNKKVNILI